MLSTASSLHRHHHRLLPASSFGRRRRRRLRRLLPTSTTSVANDAADAADASWCVSFFSTRPHGSSQTAASSGRGNAPSSSGHLADTKAAAKYSKQQAAVVDWRAWFRSPDYDDPYSPHHNTSSLSSTLQQQQQNNNNNSSEKKAEDQNTTTLLQSLSDGTWMRRRHGMNFEPLAIHDVTITNEEYITDSNEEEDGFHHDDSSNAAAAAAAVDNDSYDPIAMQRHEYRPNEEDAATATSTSNTKRLHQRLQWMDAQTRFLCRMLDDLYRTGIRRETDRPRTERCHRAIGRLLSMTSENPPKPHELSRLLHSELQYNDVPITGLAQRTGEILSRMERCSPPALLANKHKQANKSTTSSSFEPAKEILDASSLGTPLDNANGDVSTIGTSYQGVYPTYPQHLSNTKYALPTPTRAIYNMTLKAYAKEGGALYVGEQAEDVVWGMIGRGLEMAERSKRHEESHESDEFDNKEASEGKSNDAELFPTLENWNCVLKCWSRSTDPDRAFHAYSFLLSWIEWNDSRWMQQQQSSIMALDNGDDGSSIIIAHPDVESYGLILQSCLAHVEEFEEESEFERAKEMGSGVAIRLWKEMLSSSSSAKDITPMTLLDAATYSEVLQAIGQTAELPNASSKTASLQALARVFTRCCQDGMVTDNILEVVKGCTTKSQFLQLKAKMM